MVWALLFNSGPVELLLVSEIFVKLQLYINAASGRVQLPPEILPKVASVTGSFYSILEDSLLSCLRKKDIAAWEVVAEIYLRIGKCPVVTSVFTEEVYKEELDKIAQSVKVKAGKEESGNVVFSRVLSLLRGVRELWFHKLIAKCDIRNVFVEGVLGPTFAKIVHELAFIFSPALPDQFHNVLLFWSQRRMLSHSFRTLQLVVILFVKFRQC